MAKNKTLFTAIVSFLILGRSRKALEILRLSIEYRLLNRLRKHLSNEISSKSNYLKHCEYEHNDSIPKIIWICWWQGFENAPELVRVCYGSIRKNFPDWDVKIITSDNYKEYVNFPDYVLEKWDTGAITNTHMSDLLRLELLINHGGMWLDATVFATSGKIPSSILESELFFYQTLKPGADGHTVTFSSWLLWARRNNRVLNLTRELLYDYWRKNNRLADYFLLHYYFTLALEFCPQEANKVPQFTNEIPHILQLNLFKRFDKSYWEDLCKMTNFHKLTYKLPEERIKDSDGTYYEHIMNNGK